MTATRNHLDMLPMRLLGENMYLTRAQWLELLDELKPESSTAGRIQELLEEPVRRQCKMGYKLSNCALCDSNTNCYR